jgi:hypothetical protein
VTTEIVDEFTRRSRRLPRWLLGTVGVACLLLGVAIIFQPFSSSTVLIAQGETDNLILPTMQAEYVQQRCDRGGDVDYRTYPGRDHVGLVADDSPLIPDLVQWTQDRLDSRPAQSTC